MVGTPQVGPGSVPNLDKVSSDKDLPLDHARRNKRLDAFAEQKDCPPLQPLPPHLVQTLQDQGIVQTPATKSAVPASPLQGE